MHANRLGVCISGCCLCVLVSKCLNTSQSFAGHAPLACVHPCTISSLVHAAVSQLQAPCCRSMEEALEALVAEAVRPPCRDGAASSQASMPAVEAELLKHEGHVHLDRCAQSNSFTLTHSITYERVALPGGHEWSLIFDDEGFGAVAAVDSEDLDPLFLEDLLKFQAYKAEGGNYFLVSKGSAGKGFVDLSAFQQKYVEQELEIQFGTSKKAISLAALKWPRHPAAKLFWSTKSLYEALNLSQFNSRPWRWCNAGFKKWVGFMAKLGLQNHVLRSAMMQDTVLAETMRLYYFTMQGSLMFRLMASCMLHGVFWTPGPRRGEPYTSHAPLRQLVFLGNALPSGEMEQHD